MNKLELFYKILENQTRIPSIYDLNKLFKNDSNNNGKWYKQFINKKKKGKSRKNY